MALRKDVSDVRSEADNPGAWQARVYLHMASLPSTSNMHSSYCRSLYVKLERGPRNYL